jgi:fucose permease
MKSSVIIYHLATALPIISFGLYLWIARPESGVLRLFLGAYLLFSMGIGFTLTTWQSYIISLFTRAESMRALSVMYIVQSCAKVLGSFVLYRTVARYALSIDGAAMVFSFGGIVLFIGSLFFLLTREEYDPGELRLPPFTGLHDFSGRLREIFAVKEFRIFIAGDFSYFAVVTALSFYGNYARDYAAIPEELIAGLFVAVSYGGGIVSQVLFGWLDLLDLKGKMITSKLFALAGILLLLPGRSFILFLFAAAMLGASRALRLLVFPPAVKAIANIRDTTPHFALVAIMEMPFSAGLPLGAGLFLDFSTGLGAGSYRILFLFLALLILVGLSFSMKLNFNGSDRENAKS